VTDLILGSAKSRVGFISRLSLFQALVNNQAPDRDNTWKATDVNWDNTLRADISRILQMSLAWQLLYDKQIALGGRFQQTLTLGLAYKFTNAPAPKKG
jgi:hypothetical protein